MHEVCLSQVYISDMLGIFLILGIVLSSSWKLQNKNNENRILFAIMVLIVTACIVDALTFTVDGRTGDGLRIVSYISNFVLYLADLFIGPLWVMIVSLHLNGRLSKPQRVFLTTVVSIILVLLIYNFYDPLVFDISENNQYSRGPLFALVNFWEAVFIADGVLVYLIAKARSGGSRFFPVIHFMWPIFVCVCLQYYFKSFHLSIFQSFHLSIFNLTYVVTWFLPCKMKIFFWINLQACSIVTIWTEFRAN